MTSTKAIATGTAATLYRCARCPKGTPANSVWRGRYTKGDTAKTALCEAHYAERNGIKIGNVNAVDPTWTRTAEAFAWELLAADGMDLYRMADYAARKAVVWTAIKEEKADAIREQFVKFVLANVAHVAPAMPTVADLHRNGQPITPREIMFAATRAYINFDSNRSGGGARGKEEADAAIMLAPAAANTCDSWDPAILAEMDPFDVLALEIFANDATPDGKDATRNDAAEYIAGRTVATKREITPAVLHAARIYAELREAALSY